MPSKNRAPIGDKTRTARAKRHLERVIAAKGKRLVVDLSADGTQALETLVLSGYGKTQKEVVEKSLQAEALKIKGR